MLCPFPWYGHVPSRHGMTRSWFCVRGTRNTMPLRGHMNRGYSCIVHYFVTLDQKILVDDVSIRGPDGKPRKQHSSLVPGLQTIDGRSIQIHESGIF